MVVLADQISMIRNQKPSLFSDIPSIDLSKPNSKSLLVKACEEVGFLKVINHGIPLEVMDRLESEAMKFFSLPQLEKEHAEAARPNRFGYGTKIIGGNGDVGSVEYLLLQANQNSISQISYQLFKEKPDVFCSAASDYISSVKRLACDVLELLADGLNIQQRTIFSRHFMGEENDSLFRINHYPPCTELQAADNLIGFGEHTDPQIISVLRSNNTSGLQISLKDGTWVSVPSDQTSFFIIVGDALQVMTNGRFRSVKHRVLTSSAKSRVSMIYFVAPALSERIAPLPLLMAEGEKSLYKGFTWSEYMESAFKTRLADNRLGVFEISCLDESGDGTCEGA